MEDPGVDEVMFMLLISNKLTSLFVKNQMKDPQIYSRAVNPIFVN